MKVGIVGGGLAGLAAGAALADAGHAVEVFERSRLLGGRATSFEIDGVEVDNGQHVFLSCCDAFQDFVQRSGLGGSLHVQNRFEAVVIENGKASVLRAGRLPAPWHLVASFARFGHLSIPAKICVARALLAASRNGGGTRTFADWLARQRQSDEAIRVFWRPFFVPALNLPLDQMDAREALFTLRTAFLRDASAARFGYSTVPLAHVAEAAAARFSCVHRATSIASIELDGASARALVTTSGERHAFDAFVVALTPTQLLRLLGDGSRFGVSSLEQYEPHPIIDVHVRFSARDALDTFDFGAVVDSPIQWIFKKGDGYLVCSMSAAEEFMRRSTDDLIAFAWAELQRALPALQSAALARGAVTRNPEATFSTSPGTARPGPGTAIENLVIAGSWTGTGWPDTMESAVRSGRAAARHILERCRAARSVRGHSLEGAT